MATKETRQRIIVDLIHEHEVASQGQLRGLLAEQGVEATQATLSRDLDELGAVKVRGADGVHVYRMTADPGPATARDRLVATLQQFVRTVDASGNLAVLRTPPAGAPPVASAIDLAELPGVLATIAGDDTVVVVASEDTPGRELAVRFRRYLEGRTHVS